MSLFLCVTPVTLPSGEVADFSNWFTAPDLGSAVLGVLARDTFLSGESAYLELFHEDTHFGSSKVSEINIATGKVITTAEAGVAYAGTATADPLPPQISVVVSISATILSRSTRGRFYLPATTIDTVAVTGRLITADVTVILDAWIGAYHAMILAGLVPVIYSRKLHSTSVAAFMNVGDVFDTMRTRRDKLVENRQQSGIA